MWQDQPRATDDDVKKTIDVFAELGAKDTGLYYRVQPDEDSRIRNLLWSTGSSRAQYHFFGDAITFDTTYRTDLYDMPFVCGSQQPLPDRDIWWRPSKR